MELDIWQQAGLGTIGGAGFVMLLFKVLTFVRKEQETQAGVGATTAQFKALQDQINQCNADNTLLRAEFNAMDRKLHTQQRTITRMEMLLRQFSTLVQEHGTPVPTHMQTELADLIKSGDEKMAIATATVVMNRRKEDQK